MIKVCKFGGTSMSDGINLRRVADIIESDPERKYIVVSAPGKRYSGDEKVTDLLYEAQKNLEETGALGEPFQKVCARFCGIVAELGLQMDVGGLLRETEQEIVKENSADFTASRGEYLAGMVTARLLGVPFIDARDIVRFDEDGMLDSERTFRLTADALNERPRAVIAGFYGASPEGRIKTFSRGGSDISGAIVARASGADLYENWSDVSGFLAADPRIVPDPERIHALSYKELRELSYMGANVLHAEAIFPVAEADIPVLIKNTFRPEDDGTYILPATSNQLGARTVTGIAGSRHFSVIYLEKSLMNAEIGFAYRVLSVLSAHGVSFEHIPSGIDTMSVVIDSKELGDGVLETLEREIKAAVRPDTIRILSGVALIAVVGHGMSKAAGTPARLFRAIGNVSVNVRMIDQGSSGLNIIVGVDNCDYERTLRAIYEEFFL